jgi:hypothetical protein
VKNTKGSCNCALALVIGGLIVAGSAGADKPEWAGKDKGGKNERAEQRAGANDHFWRELGPVRVDTGTTPLSKRSVVLVETRHAKSDQVAPTTDHDAVSTTISLPSTRNLCG